MTMEHALGSAATENDAPRDGFAELGRAIEAARADAAEERRRLRRKLFYWRFGGVLFVALIALAVLLSSNPKSQPHIAEISVRGMIIDDPKRDALFETLTTSDAVKAVVIRIDSPGGTTVGGEAIYASIRRLAEAKPVVAVFGETAASAAYLAGAAADYIVARGNSLTASVGVILTAPNIGEALDNAGVAIAEVRSGGLKAAPSIFGARDPEGLAYSQELVDEGFVWFRDLVAARRDLAPGALARISDGRVLTGRLALAEGLVDEIGGRPEAVRWLESERGLAQGLPILEHMPQKESPSFVERLAEGFLGFAPGAARAAGGPKLWSTIE